MKNKIFITAMIALLMMIAVACSSGDDTAEQSNSGEDKVPAEEKETDSSTEETRTITYLGEEYTLPKDVKNIVISGAMEAMEDSLVLDVHPVGAMTVGGEFPERFSQIVTDTEPIGEKTQPDFETILKLEPDVILASTKFPEEVVEKLEKIAPTIGYSHIATDWEANLEFLGELTGMQDEAAKEMEAYNADLQTAKEELKEKMDGKKALAVRIRGGNLFIYPETVFFNPLLYSDLGLEIIDEVKAAEAQEQISVEKLAEINPDYLFIQFDSNENAEAPDALEELEENPILNKLTAFENDDVFVNVIDSLSEGGPAWSRINFLEAAVPKLSE